MTTVAIIQARHTSTRLRGKMILPLAGIPVIEHIVRRAQSVREIDSVCVTIPEGPAQAPLDDVIRTIGDVHVSYGPDENLLRRFARAARETGADVVVRLWGDCPAIDPDAIRHLLRTFRTSGADWAYLSDQSGYPLGYECQAYKASALNSADNEVHDISDQEYVHTFFQRHPARFQFADVKRPGTDHIIPSPLQLLLDTKGDYLKLGKIFERLYPVSAIFGLSDVEKLAGTEPSLF